MGSCHSPENFSSLLPSAALSSDPMPQPGQPPRVDCRPRHCPEPSGGQTPAPPCPAETKGYSCQDRPQLLLQTFVECMNGFPFAGLFSLLTSSRGSPKALQGSSVTSLALGLSPKDQFLKLSLGTSPVAVWGGGRRPRKGLPRAGQAGRGSQPAVFPPRRLREPACPTPV